MEGFFKLVSCDQALERLESFNPVGEELVALDDALERVCRTDLKAPVDLPDFSRSTMDGYAVRARDTFGATESVPVFFELCGEVEMGRPAGFSVGAGQAASIATGGMLPDGADAVVMVEYCHSLDSRTIEVSRAVSVLENVIRAGDDVRRGTVVIKSGSLFNPQEIGLCAGLGVTSLKVFKKPRVGIISTGDEIVPADRHPGPGKVRDINRHSLAAFCRRRGAEPVCFGICPDLFEPLREMVATALGETDTVWLSGGSSVGTRDLTLKVLKSLPGFELFAHGVAIKPGKPTIIGACSGKPLIGLPGQVSSALVVAEVFLTPLLKRLSGYAAGENFEQLFVEAVLSRNIESAGGREEYVRVSLTSDGDHPAAEPIFGKSGLISTLVVADGLVRIPLNSEGLYAGQIVSVRLLNR